MSISPYFSNLPPELKIEIINQLLDPRDVVSCSEVSKDLHKIIRYTGLLFKRWSMGISLKVLDGLPQNHQISLATKINKKACKYGEPYIADTLIATFSRKEEKKELLFDAIRILIKQNQFARAKLYIEEVKTFCQITRSKCFENNIDWSAWTKELTTLGQYMAKCGDLPSANEIVEKLKLAPCLLSKHPYIFITPIHQTRGSLRCALDVVKEIFNYLMKNKNPREAMRYQKKALVILEALGYPVELEYVFMQKNTIKSLDQAVEVFKKFSVGGREGRLMLIKEIVSYCIKVKKDPLELGLNFIRSDIVDIKRNYAIHFAKKGDVESAISYACSGSLIDSGQKVKICAHLIKIVGSKNPQRAIPIWKKSKEVLDNHKANPTNPFFESEIGSATLFL